MNAPGLFGDMFDFNDDGKLDLFEEACEVDFYNKLMDEKKEDDDCWNDINK